MSFRATVLKRSCLVAFLLGFIAVPAAFGQAPNSPIAFVSRDAILTTLVTAPNIGTADASGGPSTPGQWLQVEFHYGTTSMLKTPYLDAVEFKVWIEGLDPLATNAQGGKGVGVALTGSVTYVNVLAGKDIYGVFYVHPSVLGRYSSTRGVEDFTEPNKFDVHIEAYVGGALMDEINKNKEQDPLNWFKPLTVVPSMVYRQDQCPFLVSNPDRYPMIKPPAATP
jgi:hypothetical protein